MNQEEYQAKLIQLNNLIVKLRNKMGSDDDKLLLEMVIALVRSSFEHIFFDSVGNLKEEILDYEEK